MRQFLRRWFGIRCLVLWCPGEIVNSKGLDHGVYWRCAICGAHTRP